MKDLLLEYIPFQASQNEIKESITTNNGKLIVSGVLQRAGAKNQNGRVYPKEILQREAEKYNNEFVKQNRALGETDHPSSSVVNLANASHHITKMWWNEDDLMGKVEILPTPSGNILKSLLNAGITLGISSRGVGSVKEVFTEDRQAYLQVQEDFELIAFDFVSNPSTHGAFMIPVNEAVNKGENKDKKINDIITNIICDVQGFCSCD